MANERFDLVALQLLDAKVRREPLIEKVQPRTFSAGEKIRACRQSCRKGGVVSFENLPGADQSSSLMREPQVMRSRRRA